MTLGTSKKIALALIDEYSKTSDNLSEDEDILLKINLLFNTSYQYLSQIKKINATSTLDRTEKGNTLNYREYNLPTDFYQLKSVVIKDGETKEKLNVKTDFYIENNKIFVNDESDGEYVILYYKYPTEINEETEDSFVLELDQDACNVLPYAVASDILKSDVSMDYSIFEKKYQSMLEMLDNRKDLSITIGSL